MRSPRRFAVSLASLVGPAVLAATPLVAFAQSSTPPPRGEIYLGMPLLYRKGTGVWIPAQGAVTVNVRSWLGVTGEIGVYIGEALYEKPLYTFLAGPELSLRSKRVRGFTHVLVGGAHSGCADFSLDRGCIGIVSASTVFGGGADIRPRDRIAVRAGADALLTSFGESHQTFLRLTFGVVFPLGN